MLAWGQVMEAFQGIPVVLVTVAIVVAIVWANGGNLQAAVLPSFGEVSIGDFSVEVIDGSNFEVSYHILGPAKKIGKIEVRRHYRHYPDSGEIHSKSDELVAEGELSFPNVVRDNTFSDNFDEKNGILTASVPIYDSSIFDPKQDEAAGLHRFSLQVFGRDGEVTDDADVKIGIYYEDYVETLNTPIDGCGSGVVDDCKVIECKKERTNSYTHPLSFDFSSWPEANRILQELIDSSCVELQPDYPRLVFDGCSASQVHEFNTAFVRLRFFDAAHMISGLKSESEYKDNMDKLGDFKEFALQASVECSYGSGVYDYFSASPEWERLPGDEGGQTIEDVENELQKVIGNLEPGVGDFEVSFADHPIKGLTARLSWSLVGSNNIHSQVLEHCWRKYARDAKYVADEEGECESVGLGEVKRYELATPLLKKEGMHTFAILINDESADAVKTGFYTLRYIELYNGVIGYPKVNKNDRDDRWEITVCVEHPHPTKTDDVCEKGGGDPNRNGNIGECGKDCNVFEKKRSGFLHDGSSHPGWPAWVKMNSAYGDWKGLNEGSACRWNNDDGNYELVACSPEEVDELYRELLQEWSGSLADAFYNCEPFPEYDWDDYDDYGSSWKLVKEVCKAKDRLEQTLSGNGNKESYMDWKKVG